MDSRAGTERWLHGAIRGIEEEGEEEGAHEEWRGRDEEGGWRRVERERSRRRLMAASTVGRERAVRKCGNGAGKERRVWVCELRASGQFGRGETPLAVGSLRVNEHAWM